MSSSPIMGLSYARQHLAHGVSGARFSNLAVHYAARRCGEETGFTSVYSRALERVWSD